MGRLRGRQEYQFFGALLPGRARAWPIVVVGRARAAGAAARVDRGRDRHADRRGAAATTRSPGRSTLVGIVFVLFQVLTPLHLAVSANLGSRCGA